MKPKLKEWQRASLVNQIYDSLRNALQDAVAADAPKLAAKIRLAISSAKGARRQANNRVAKERSA